MWGAVHPRREGIGSNEGGPIRLLLLILMLTLLTGMTLLFLILPMPPTPLLSEGEALSDALVRAVVTAAVVVLALVLPAVSEGEEVVILPGIFPVGIGDGSGRHAFGRGG